MGKNIFNKKIVQEKEIQSEIQSVIPNAPPKPKETLKSTERTSIYSLIVKEDQLSAGKLKDGAHIRVKQTGQNLQAEKEFLDSYKERNKETAKDPNKTLAIGLLFNAVSYSQHKKMAHEIKNGRLKHRFVPSGTGSNQHEVIVNKFPVLKFSGNTDKDGFDAFCTTLTDKLAQKGVSPDKVVRAIQREGGITLNVTRIENTREIDTKVPWSYSFDYDKILSAVDKVENKAVNKPKNKEENNKSVIQQFKIKTEASHENKILNEAFQRYVNTFDQAMPCYTIHLKESAFHKYETGQPLTVDDIELKKVPYTSKDRESFFGNALKGIAPSKQIEFKDKIDTMEQELAILRANDILLKTSNIYKNEPVMLRQSNLELVLSAKTEDQQLKAYRPNGLKNHGFTYKNLENRSLLTREEAIKNKPKISDQPNYYKGSSVLNEHGSSRKIKLNKNEMFPSNYQNESTIPKNQSAVLDAVDPNNKNKLKDFSFDRLKTGVSMVGGVFVKRNNVKNSPTLLLKDPSASGVLENKLAEPIIEKIASNLARLPIFMGNHLAPKTELVSHTYNSQKCVFLASEFIPGFTDIGRMRENEGKTEPNDANDKTARGQFHRECFKEEYTKYPSLYKAAAASIALGNHDFNAGNLGIVNPNQAALIDLGEALQYSQYPKSINVLQRGCEESFYDPKMFINSQFADQLEQQAKAIEANKRNIEKTIQKSVSNVKKAYRGQDEKFICEKLSESLGQEVKSFNDITNVVSQSLQARTESMKELATTVRILDAIERDDAKTLKELLDKNPSLKQQGTTLTYLALDEKGVKTQEFDLKKLIRDHRKSDEPKCKHKRTFQEIERGFNSSSKVKSI
ncbi:MAG: hypothetical protein IPP74_09470 [Alphaproteobacteria bacterium]|nr:hypothetical protein [Alphaproteobacteria bacterium]